MASFKIVALGNNMLIPMFLLVSECSLEVTFRERIQHLVRFDNVKTVSYQLDLRLRKRKCTTHRFFAISLFIISVGDFLSSTHNLMFSLFQVFIRDESTDTIKRAMIKTL